VNKKAEKMTLHKFIILFGTFVILLTLTIALFAKKTDRPAYLKYIVIYIILGLLISANTISHIIFNQPFGQKKHILLFDLLYLFQSLALSLFFKTIIKRKIVLPLILISTLAQIIFILRQFDTFTTFDVNIFATPVFIILSIFYFRDLLQNRPLINLTKSSLFWFTVGIFFWACVSFPIYSLHFQIKEYIHNRNIIFQIFSISNMALIVMYIFFIKSFLCLKHPQNIL
jgi:hypothetical protein